MRRPSHPEARSRQGSVDVPPRLAATKIASGSGTRLANSCSIQARASRPHCGQSLQSVIPIMISEPIATTTGQKNGNSSSTLTTTALTRRVLLICAKRQPATPIGKPTSIGQVERLIGADVDAGRIHRLAVVERPAQIEAAIAGLRQLSRRLLAGFQRAEYFLPVCRAGLGRLQLD